MAIVRTFEPHLIDFTLCKNPIDAEINMQKMLSEVRSCREEYEVWAVLSANGWTEFPPPPNGFGFYYIRSAHNNVLYVEICEEGNVVQFRVGSQAKSRIREIHIGGLKP